MSLSEQLKKARMAIGYTQQQVADAMGIKNSTYCGYETGKRQPDIDKIKQLVSIFHTSSDILLETECKIDENKQTDSTLEEAMTIFQSLRPEFQDYMIEQMKRLTELQNQ